ncbi:MAG: hypothetical protein F6K35_24560 [Okeania sp. SIO2H7]|nr:hypothetical protein [Okeania sp. SIO2H7]
MSCFPLDDLANFIMEMGIGQWGSRDGDRVLCARFAHFFGPLQWDVQFLCAIGAIGDRYELLYR